MITFREYILEIENNIEQNLLDQVIAHSSYILKTYPNSIDGLRLLGQAYLEEKKFAEALPCFEKVLSFIPDDFVSHVGISAIKEEDRDINSAIFHMELAFDTQPSNNIVQEELKRLIEKRDGVKPPKINLSKGALIRMYMKGELLQQALNEIESALSASPNRMDLQVLLANVQYSSNSKVQAAETCNQIIDHLPYCLDANRILYKIYLENGLQEQASIVKERLVTLNPYYQFVDSPKVEVEEIQDDKVELERLSYTSAFSANIEDYIPEVSKTSKERFPEPPSQKLPSIMDEIESPKDEIFPDFLSNAGWEKTDNPHNEPPEPISEFMNETPEIPAEKGPLPDWLENFQLSSEFLEKKPAVIPDESIGIINNSYNSADVVTNIDINPTDNLSSINEVEMSADTPQSPFEKDESSDWMSQFFDEAKDTSSKSEDDKQLPDWLKSFDQKDQVSEENSKEEVPDWLKSLDSDIVGKEEVSSPQIESTPTEKKDDEPDWFRSLVSDNESQTEVGETDGVPTEQPETEALLPEQDLSSFSFLDSINEKEVTIPETPDMSQEQKPLPDDDFLKSLGISDIDLGPQDNKDQELTSLEPIVAEPSDNALPDWVKSVLTEPEETAVIKEPDTEPGIEPVHEPGTVPDFEYGTKIEVKQVNDANLSAVVSIEDLLPSDEKAATTENPQGAISQETSEELLSWLKTISPDTHEESPVDKVESPQTNDIPQASESLEDSLGRLEETINEIVTPEPENQSFDISQENIEETIVKEEITSSEVLGPEEKLASEALAAEEIPQSEYAEETSIDKSPDSVGFADPLEKLLSTITDGRYSEATEYLPELEKSGVGTEKILETINSLKPDRINDFNYLQFLGDTLAGYEHFEEAMDVYNQAENILK